MQRNYKKYLIVTLLFFTSLSIVYQLAVVENPNFNIYDFAASLLSEFAGMIFTVLVFDQFINQRNRMALANKNAKLTKELNVLIKELERTFLMPINQCLGQTSKEILWNPDTFTKIRNEIQINQIVTGTFPQVPWYLFFSMQGEKLERICDNILLRYQDTMDGDISDMIFYLLRDSEMFKDLKDIKKVYEADLLSGYKREQNLGSYFASPTVADFALVDKLKQWVLRYNSTEEKNKVRNHKLRMLSAFIFLLVFPVVSIKVFISGDIYLGFIYLSVTAAYTVSSLYYKYKEKKAKQEPGNPE